MKTTRGTQSTCLLVWGLVAALLSQNFVFPAFSASFQDEKNFFLFPPYPGVIGSPPVVPVPSIDPSPPFSPVPSINPSPPIVYTSPPPTHGSGGGSTPAPVHHTPTPSHGGGSSGGHRGHGKAPPTNCGNPTPHSPPKHVDPSPSHHNPSPAPPTYSYSPPPSGGGSSGSGGSPGGSGSGSTPSPIVLPPITPTLPNPSSPPFDPNSPPVIGGTCDFWRNHPTVIWGLFGWWGTTMGAAFGVTTLPGTGANLNLVQALSNTRTDGIGALYREGTASLLNSMVNKNFPYTTSHVKDSFVAATVSNKAAGAQARVFKLANEGHMKLRH